MRGNQGVEREKVEGRGAVYDDEIVVVGKGSQSSLQAAFAFILIHEVKIRRDQVLIGRKKCHAEVRLSNGVFGGGLPKEDVVDCFAVVIL